MRGGLVRAVLRWPPWLYQRCQRTWERAVLSAGWAMLYVLCDASVQAFPVQWRGFWAACILVGGLYRPALAYALFVAAIAYPLYLISIYVMALALAALVLSWSASPGGWGRGDTWCHGDTWYTITLLILLAPLLAPVYLTPVLPLLMGLWWGEGGGAVAGGLAALWLKICAGLAGSSVDLWQVNGWTMTIGPLYERFHTANSLQTLIRLVEPLVREGSGGESAPGISLVLLFNLLQVVAWAAAGYVVGFLARWLLRPERFYASAWERARATGFIRVLSLGPGLLLIGAGYVAVPAWLHVEGPGWAADVARVGAVGRIANPTWLPAQVVWAGVVAWGLDSLLRYLRRPIVPGQAVRRDTRSREYVPPPTFLADNDPGSSDLQQSKKKRVKRLHKRGQDGEPEPKAEDEEGVIRLELD